MTMAMPLTKVLIKTKQYKIPTPRLQKIYDNHSDLTKTTTSCTRTDEKKIMKMIMAMTMTMAMPITKVLFKTKQY